MANDTDAQRAYMLVHQAKRLNLPALFVTNNDATKFPNLKFGADCEENFKFDRILCDVPCSGDGTLRKNPLLWKTFHAHLGHSLHALQRDILIRGLSMLKKGGRMTYSTCSFNPIENEAVVQAALLHFKGKIQLVKPKVSEHLKCRPGMLRWKVYHKKKSTHHPAEWYQNWAQVPPQR